MGGGPAGTAAQGGWRGLPEWPAERPIRDCGTAPAAAPDGTQAAGGPRASGDGTARLRPKRAENWRTPDAPEAPAAGRAYGPRGPENGATVPAARPGHRHTPPGPGPACGAGIKNPRCGTRSAAGKAPYITYKKPSRKPGRGGRRQAARPAGRQPISILRPAFLAASSVLGRSMVSTPLSTWAATLSFTTSSGRSSVCSYLL